MEKNWEELKARAKEYALENILENGMNCSESVFSALIRCGAIDAAPEAVAYATGFGGGGGGTGLTCGALASAILANNMVHGRTNPTGASPRTELKEHYYQRFNNIVSDFVKVSGSGLCGEIVNQFENGYVDENTRPNCIRIVGEAAWIAVEYLQKSMEEVSALAYDPAVVRTKNWM